MKAAAERILIRWIHLVTGGVIAMYIYSPWYLNETFSLVTKAIVVPFVIATGLWLWKGHVVKKRFKNRIN